MSTQNRWLALGAAMLGLSLLASGALAQQPEHGHGGHAPRQGQPSQHYDNLYSHNRYYTQPGAVVGAVPGCV